MRATRNRTIWENVLAPVRQWLIEHPTASARDAGRQFNLAANLIANHLGDEFNFVERRTLRGKRHKRAQAKAAAGVTQDEMLAMVVEMRKEMRMIRAALTRLGLNVDVEDQ